MTIEDMVIVVVVHPTVSEWLKEAIAGVHQEFRLPGVRRNAQINCY
jgi:hypothetical protein